MRLFVIAKWCNSHSLNREDNRDNRSVKFARLTINYLCPGSCDNFNRTKSAGVVSLALIAQMRRNDYLSSTQTVFLEWPELAPTPTNHLPTHFRIAAHAQCAQ
jgi:hypothetical protein